MVIIYLVTSCIVLPFTLVISVFYWLIIGGTVWRAGFLTGCIVDLALCQAGWGAGYLADVVLINEQEGGFGRDCIRVQGRLNPLCLHVHSTYTCERSPCAVYHFGI